METNFEIVDKKGVVSPVEALAFLGGGLVAVTVAGEVLEFTQDPDSGKITSKKYAFRTKGTEGEGNVVAETE